jgi:hypothetical protein
MTARKSEEEEEEEGEEDLFIYSSHGVNKK